MLMIYATVLFPVTALLFFTLTIPLFLNLSQLTNAVWKVLTYSAMDMKNMNGLSIGYRTRFACGEGLGGDVPFP